MTIDKNKYAEVLQVLLSSPANNSKLGKVKLMKLLYYVDFDHYAEHGESITGDTYYKLPYGPVPANAQSVIDMLQDVGVLDVKYGPVYNYMKYYFMPRNAFPPDGAKYLSAAEKETISSVIEKWANHSTEEIVLASHGEPPWQMVPFGSAIPYEYVGYRENVGANERDEEPEITPNLRAC